MNQLSFPQYYAHDRVDQPVMGPWKSEESGTRTPASGQRDGFLLEQSIQRWENEGGEFQPAIQSGRESS